MKKTVLTTLVLGMTLTGAAGVYAGTQLDKITAYLNHTITFQVDGQAFTPKDGSGKSLTAITYNNLTYLPVRALSDALDVPVTYDAGSKQVRIGSSSISNGSDGGETGAVSDLVSVSYSAEQKKAIKAAFAQFDGFETAYAPVQAAKGDAYVSVGAGDGVTLRFTHMTVSVSPRDYSGGYAAKGVKLSNGTAAKWYTPDKTPLLGFQLDDRFVTLSSPDGKVSAKELEQIAVSVQKLK
ncbi:hypothetical protein ACE6ED_03260 [Paenibacillus sp. CN-4]|uniref:hypothetical protein n=1 Tax=Paenibacillus nanchangensis TaxID=3348343 RepID=UPI0039781744